MGLLSHLEQSLSVGQAPLTEALFTEAHSSADGSEEVSPCTC
jgi:hypothetical protein